MEAIDGKFFYCGETCDYVRENLNFVDDYIIVDCECQKCGKAFKETFALIETSEGENE